MIFTVGNFHGAFAERGDDVRGQGADPQLGTAGIIVLRTRDEADRVADRVGGEVYGVIADWITETHEAEENVRRLSRSAKLVCLNGKD